MTYNLIVIESPSPFSLRLDRNGTAWNEPVKKTIEMSSRLAATTFGFSAKVWLMTAYVLPVLLYSVPFSPPSDAQIEAMRVQMTKALWGGHWRARSSEAVLTVLLKAHAQSASGMLLKVT
eukprot:TRINITY_DN590_c0_g1_i1.p1 TRINITY_DN590_c0_g1~~TRINITY_DN590_c0_g1_i1.p1  ORF type:complete len:120 (-),score=28.09 TRINITY_DN590_c0_g1_i1:370-729(-)